MIAGSIMRHYELLLYEEPTLPAKRVTAHRPPVGKQPLKRVCVCLRERVSVCVCVCE